MTRPETDPKLHIWKFAEAITRLLHEACVEQNIEAAGYYGRELTRVAEPIFSTPAARAAETASPPPHKPTPESLQPSRLSRKGQPPKTPVRRKEQARQPILLENHKKILELTLLSETPLANLDELAKALDPKSYVPRGTHTMKNVAAKMRCSKTLKNSLKKSLELLEAETPLTADDQKLIERIKEKHDVSSREHFQRLAERTLATYQVGGTATALEAKRIHVAKNRRVRSATELDETPANGPAEWLVLLEAALLHVQGPTLDPALIATRTGISLRLANPMLKGALEMLKRYWNNEAKPDAKTSQLIAAIKERWSEPTLELIINSINSRIERTHQVG